MSNARTYQGSLAQFHGLTIAHQERCTCHQCPADPFTCPTCGERVEYLWGQCPHTPPSPRVSLWLSRPGQEPVHLVHVRPTSVHHSSSCSP